MTGKRGTSSPSPVYPYTKDLVNNGIIPLTIHDSVIVKTKGQAKTIKIMNGVFMKQIGVIPSFSIKSLQI